MKKIMTALLVLTLAATMLAACGNKNTTQPTEGTKGPASALEALETIWGKYSDDQKFSVIGGDMENPVDNAPGAYSETQIQNLTGTLVIPQDWIAQVEGAATMIHMMNANTFTAGAVQLKQDASAEGFGAAMEQALKNNQWICGVPEELRIVNLGGNCVVIAFGAADLLSPFETNLKQAYPDARTLYTEVIG